MSDSDDPQTFTDTDIYVVREHNERGQDGIEMVFEDDAETLRQVIGYATGLSDSDSTILTGEFHAANPGFPHIEHGDWYLEKRHGVGISHGLCPDVPAGLMQVVDADEETLAKIERQIKEASKDPDDFPIEEDVDDR